MRTAADKQRLFVLKSQDDVGKAFIRTFLMIEYSNGFIPLPCKFNSVASDQNEFERSSLSAE